MSSRARKGQLSPRCALQRRTRNGWLTILCVICLSLGIEIAVYVMRPATHATAHAHLAIKTAIPVHVPLGCGLPDSDAQQQTAIVLPHTVVLPADMAPLHVTRDINGTLVVFCTSTAPPVVHDALQHALLAEGWQVADDITANGTMSLTFLRDDAVIFVTVATQPTTPPTTQITVTLPH